MKIINHRTNGEVPVTGIINHNVNAGIPRLQEIKGKLRHFPDENNDGCSDEIAKILGLSYYSSRSACISEPGDIVQLDLCLKEHADYAIRHFNRCGIEIAAKEDFVWDDSFKTTKEILNGHNNDLSFFFYGNKANTVCEDERRLQVVKKMNSKNEFIKISQSLGIKTPKTFCFDNKLQIGDLNIFEFPLLVKISVATAGLGNEFCRNIQELEDVLNNHVMDNVEFQIQEQLDVLGVIVLLYKVQNGELKRFCANEMIVKDNAHAGNVFPTVHQPWYLTDKVAQKMCLNGIKDHFAFDVLIVRNEKGRIEYLPIEVGPRFGGGSYASELSMKYNIPCWKNAVYKTSYSSLSKIDFSEIEFSQKTKNGIIVINWGTIKKGELGIMICGNPTQQQKIEEKLLKII